MNACLVTCTDVIKNDSGEVIEVHATYDPDSLGGQAPDGRRVKGTLHWVSAAHAVDTEVRLYDHLFDRENPDDTEEGEDFLSAINPDSLEIISNAKVEPALLNNRPDERFQFVRNGYFYMDPQSSGEKKLVFNRVVSLRDSWAKQQKKQK